MATLLLSAAGSALGGALGGSIAGLGTAVLGKALGATLGSAIDQRLLGSGSDPVETGRVERFQVMGASEGTPLPRVYGRMRVAGQIIWSSRFLEAVHEEEVGGKGGGTSLREFSYSVSLALALCEGEVLRIGRIWADGQVLDQSGLEIRLYRGSETQDPDPMIAAIEGAGRAPAYRGTAYLVFEALDLTPFGNRIPQFNVEVFRRPPPGLSGVAASPWDEVRGVALVPGTGEYALATAPVFLTAGDGEARAANVHNDRGLPDLEVSLDQLQAELPAVGSVSLVVSWFGNDLRCGRCRLQPAVEQTVEDGEGMPWSVAGVARAGATVVSRLDGRPVFGGTPADAAVLQAIATLKERGQAVMFYPFLLMDIQSGNGLADPWSGAADQPAVPWRGRITLDKAPGRPGSSDRSAAAAAEVAAFFGTAGVSDYAVVDGRVIYSGPEEWSYRRFILHYAHLCALAGGVDAFCIGSEMRAFGQVRDGSASYPAVRALVALAEDVRTVLGPAVRLGYAADWSEYFGHQPADGSGDAIFHLDPLWAHPAIDFVGIDNYMPLSDWRDGAGHADADAGSIYDLAALTRSVGRGEGYDWFYADAADRAAQQRTAISDGAYGEPWLFRYKDIAAWWSRPHRSRIGGVKVGEDTAWVPRSKPIWFTELGCPAVDKGTNQPNVFHDPKSSESFFPHFSDGSRDDFIQYRYLQATFAYWGDTANNPLSDQYDGRMVDLARAHVWAWDARPWPDFPARSDVWADGDNHDRGHWLSGRSSGVALAEVVGEVAARAGVEAIATERLHGLVTGYAIEAVESGRQSLQPLMLAYGFDALADAGELAFVSRGGAASAVLDLGAAVREGEAPVVVRERQPASETAQRIGVGFLGAERDYQAGMVAARAPDAAEPRTEAIELPLVLREGEATAIARRALAEAMIARDTLRCAVPPSRVTLGPGDVVAAEGRLYRIDRVEAAGARRLTAVRIEPEVYSAPVQAAPAGGRAVVEAVAPARVLLLDLPLLGGEEAPLALHAAAVSTPWRGPVAVYAAPADHGYRLLARVRRPASVGTLLEPLPRGEPGLWMPVTVLVAMTTGLLQARGEADVLNGANAAAVCIEGSGPVEVIQFTSAELVAPGAFRIGGLLRGQAGTDGVAPAEWPAGATFVLIDRALEPVAVPAAARGLERHYRTGPATRPYDHPSYRHRVAIAEGASLRPYRPAHLGARRLGDGTIRVDWIRRTRLDGDSWAGPDVPLGEEREAYLVQISLGAALLRSVTVERPRLDYSAAEQAADGATGPLTIEVAQLSLRFGAGPFGRIGFDG